GPYSCGLPRLLFGSLPTLKASQCARPPAPPNPRELAGLAAEKPERPHPAMARQDGAIHCFQEPDGAAHAVAGVPFAPPARTLPDMEILEQHRIAELEHLRIGQPRVGHVGVDRVGAVEAGAGGRAGADRLVI